jgi:hypothetical protein
MTMTAVIAPNNVIRIGHRKYCGGIGFLSNVGVRCAKQLPRRKFSQGALFKPSYKQHAAIEIVILSHES